MKSVLVLAALILGQAPQAPRPPQAPPVREDAPAYADLRAQALKETRPLAVWIGYKCPSSCNQVPGFLHHHVAETKWRDLTGPGVQVLVPGGDGWLYRADFISADQCCAKSIKEAAEATARKLEAWKAQRGAELRQRTQANFVPAAQPSSFMMHLRGWSTSTDGNCRG